MDNQCDHYPVSGLEADRLPLPTALGVDEMDAVTLTALAASRIDPRHDHLSALMD